jgi:hypothetical protein
MIKTLSTVVIVSAVLASPAFAQEKLAPHKPVHALRHYRGTYNQVQEPAIIVRRAPASGDYFENDSFDRSRVGGHDPDFNPSN